MGIPVKIFNIFCKGASFDKKEFKKKLVGSGSYPGYGR
jgi:hypothetical protein